MTNCLGLGQDPTTSSSQKAVVFAGSEDGRLCVWDLQSKRLGVRIAAHKGESHSLVRCCRAENDLTFDSDVVLACDAHPNLDMIATASSEQEPVVKLWHPNTSVTDTVAASGTNTHDV